MPKREDGWDGPLAITIDTVRFQKELAVAMEAQTPQQTGALRAANRIFKLSETTFKIANKMPYALAQHDGATFKQGVTWWQRHGTRRVMHTRRVLTWSIPGHQWVPKGLDRATQLMGVRWQQEAS